MKIDEKQMRLYMKLLELGNFTRCDYIGAGQSIFWERNGRVVPISHDHIRSEYSGRVTPGFDQSYMSLDEVADRIGVDSNFYYGDFGERNDFEDVFDNVVKAVQSL